jgi:hypothetical protein
VRLWTFPENGAAQPTLQRVLRVPIAPAQDGALIPDLALSPDGQIVAVGGLDFGSEQKRDNAVYIFDVTTGRLVHRLGKNPTPMRRVAFSPDGKYLVAALASTEGLRVWDTRGWSLVAEDKDYGGRSPEGLAFASTGKLYTVSPDGYLRRYGPDFKLEMKSKTLGDNQPRGIAVHPNGDRLAVGFVPRGSFEKSNLTIDVYDAQSLTRLYSAAGAAAGEVAWSANGQFLYAEGYDSTKQGYEQFGSIRIWDQEGRGAGRNVAVVPDRQILSIVPCGNDIAVSTQGATFGLMSVTGEKRVWRESVLPDMRWKIHQDFTVSEDGAKVRFGLDIATSTDPATLRVRRPVMFDVAAGRLSDASQADGSLAAADTESLKLTDLTGRAPKLDGKPLEFDLASGESSYAAAIASGGDQFVLGTSQYLRAFDRNGKLMWKVKTPTPVEGVNIPRGGKFVVAAYRNGTIHWHRLSDGKEILTLLVNSRTLDWLLWTPQGYYTSSVNGDQYVGWHLNKGLEQAAEFISAARLKKHLYRPDIVKRAFEIADADAAVREAGLTGFKLADLANHTPPEFRIIDPGDRTRANKSPVAVTLELSATNDPVQSLDAKVNGLQVTPRDVRDIDQPSKSSETRALNIPLEKGENHIQITARNGIGETVQDLFVYLDEEGLLNKKGKLFIVAVGVDKYPKLGSRYTLRYAGADARLMIDTLTKKAGPLHTDVIPKLLVSDGDVPPTKANIEDALGTFRDAGPNDTVILFLASHGVNDGADYLMIPEDAELNAGRWRPSSVVTWSVLQKALQDAQGKRIMFVDTCHASGAYSPRLVKDAADANIVVFSATDKDTEAQETTKLGHGVFTYAVSEGINGGADFGKKGLINMWALAEYVSDEVKRLTNDEQDPVISTSGVKNFLLATP